MTDPIDDLIRDRMRDSYPLEHGSTSVLDELRPQMVRARSRRRAIHAAASATGVAALVIGAIMFVPWLNDGDSSHLELAGPTESTLSSDSVDSKSPSNEFGRTVQEPTDPSTAETTSVAPTTSESSEQPSTSESARTAAPTTEASTTTVEEATTATSQGTTTSANSSSTADQSTSTSAQSSSTTIETESNVITTNCGTVEVELVGSGIRLVSTNPNADVSVEVKDSGPETIEVRFTSGDRDCEVHAENRGGQVWSDVGDDPSDHIE